MEVTWIVLIAGAMFVIIGGVFVLNAFFNLDKERNYSSYNKKSSLFESSGELSLYKTLVELFEGRYYVFPQMHFSSLMTLRSDRIDWKDKPNVRSRLDRKPADFVLASREHAEPLLIIELDNETHNFSDKKTRDHFIKDVSRVMGLPLIHLKPNMGREEVRAAVEHALST